MNWVHLYNQSGADALPLDKQGGYPLLSVDAVSGLDGL